jgi:carboxyl-terminal processing protease
MHSARFSTALLTAKFWALASICALLSSCGGGGGSSDFPPSSSVANQCTAPRPGTSDGPGSIDTEKTWVRSFMNETYLWYQDIPQVDPAGYTAAAYGNSTYKALDAYFRALKTTKTTASGSLVDKFSFTVSTADLVKQQSGIASGYGIKYVVISQTPFALRVAYVEQGSPAQMTGVQRGDTLISIDGININDNTKSSVAVVNAGLNPTANKTTVFGFQSPGAAIRSVSITSSDNIAVSPVTLTSTFAVGSSTVGYLTLNTFGANNAEKQLIDAVGQLKAANINELVLDLRYNGGGFTLIANQLAWMIGNSNLAGKIFEKNICNDKTPFPICNLADAFRQTSLGFSVAKGQALPQLGLKRVFVLTSSSTCSASEAVINGLSPFMQVVRIGSTSCGKPYGFYFTPNCGTSYAAMQLKGVNADGFGDFTDGFAATCQVADDLTKPRGDANELMLAGALKYISTGSCPAVNTGILKQQSKAIVDEGNYQVWRDLIEEQRILGGPEGAR